MSWLKQLRAKPSLPRSSTQALVEICAILSRLDDQQQALLEAFSHVEHHIQVMHERQLAILERLRFMVRVEESQLTHIEHLIEGGDLPPLREEPPS